MNLNEHVQSIFEAVREPLGLDRWQIRLGAEKLEDSRAACIAQPEYREADLYFDAEKIKTGDDLAELTVHEMAHCHTFELHSLAEELADALAESAPESHRESLRKLFHEKVRQAGERCTTDVGHTYLRLLRRAGILDNPPVGN
jgi:hypothetical protein